MRTSYKDSRTFVNVYWLFFEKGTGFIVLPLFVKNKNATEITYIHGILTFLG